MILSSINIIYNELEISSTEFQQNVGYYLDLVDKGEEVKIMRLKPAKSPILLSKDRRAKRGSEKKKHPHNLLQKLEKYMVNEGGESGLEIQKRVRS